MNRIKKLVLACVATTALVSAAVHANTVNFSADAWQNINGTSQNGFTFGASNGGYWGGGLNAGSAPYMEYYDQNHWVTYDGGSFDLASFSLISTPWDGYQYSGGLLTVNFLDLLGNITTSQTLN